jgi:hypothetical protein
MSMRKTNPGPRYATEEAAIKAALQLRERVADAWHLWQTVCNELEAMRVSGRCDPELLMRAIERYDREDLDDLRHEVLLNSYRDAWTVDGNDPWPFFNPLPGEAAALCRPLVGDCDRIKHGWGVLIERAWRMHADTTQPWTWPLVKRNEIDAIEKADG